MPYEGLDDRMDRLETVLTDFIRHTDKGMAALREGMAAFREDMTAFREDMTAFRREVDRDIIEMRQWRIQSQKRWGEIAEKMGKFVEDIAAPNIPRLAQEAFQIGTEEVFSAPRLRLRHPQDPSKMR